MAIVCVLCPQLTWLLSAVANPRQNTIQARDLDLGWYCVACRSSWTMQYARVPTSANGEIWLRPRPMDSRLPGWEGRAPCLSRQINRGIIIRSRLMSSL
ncbi:hypothetical protein BJY01DRAFT_216030, partial [Aspergillus pseudoustus]